MGIFSRETRKRRDLFIVILLAGFFLRFWGLSSDLMRTDDAAVAQTILAVYHGVFNEDSILQSSFFFTFFPALVMKGISVFLSTIFFHKEASVYPFTLSQTIFLSRVVIAFMGFLSIPVLYLSMKRLAREQTALLGTFLFSISFVHIFHSHRLAPDIPAAFFVLLCLYCSLAIYESGRWHNYFLAGVFAGLAALSKPAAGLAVLVIVCAHFLRWQRGKPLFPTVFSLKLFLGVFSFLLGLVMGHCVFIKKFPSLTRSMSLLFRLEPQPENISLTMKPAGIVGQMLTTKHGQAFAHVFSVEGAIFFFLIVFGVVMIFFLKRKKETLLFFAFPILYLAAISLIGMRSLRDLVFLSPFYSSVAALGLFFLVDRRWKKRGRTTARAVVALLLIAIFGRAVCNGYLIWDDDTSEISHRWMLRNMSEETRNKTSLSADLQEHGCVKEFFLKEIESKNAPIKIYRGTNMKTQKMRLPLPDVPYQKKIPREFEILDGSPYGKETKSFWIEEGDRIERIFISRKPLRGIAIFFLSNESDGSVAIRNSVQKKTIKLEKGKNTRIVMKPFLSFPYHKYRYSIRIEGKKGLRGSFVRVVPDQIEAGRPFPDDGLDKEARQETSIDPDFFAESKSIKLQAEDMEQKSSQLVESDSFSGGKGMMFMKDGEEGQLSSSRLILYPGKYSLQLNVIFLGAQKSIHSSIAFIQGNRKTEYRISPENSSFSENMAKIDLAFDISELKPFSIHIAIKERDTFILDYLKISPSLDGLFLEK